METTKHQIVIIGGGTAGIMVAAQLLRENKNLDIALIEPSSKHYYQPAWTLVGAGTYDFKATEKDEKKVIPSEVKWVKDYAEKFEPEKNLVSLRSGKAIKYDYLVVAPGIQINLDGVPGLKEAFGKGGVCSNYVDPKYTWEVLKNFKDGNALFTQANTPIKCGGAPQKIMYLADDYFIKEGIKDKTNTIFATPGSVIFGVPDFAKTLRKVVNRKKIVVKFFMELARIDGEAKKAYFRILPHQEDQETSINGTIDIKEEKTGENEIAIPYEMLHLAPPQSAPDFIKASPLAATEGDFKGWLDVDINSLQHHKYPNIFGAGDVAGVPTARTGAAVRKQAPVVVDNILRLMAGKDATNKNYQGYSSCPLVTGYGKMVLAEFKYENIRDSDPFLSKFMDTSKESWFLWILKKYGLPFLYWKKMMKGKM